MWIQTHLLIGAAVGHMIACQSPEKLELRAFQFGCILPDFHPRYMNISHCKNESFKLVRALIRQTGRSSPDAVDTSGYSVRLGIITHFICDYFCRAHNYHEYDSHIPHLIYEGQLHQEFKRTCLDQLCADFGDSVQIAGNDLSEYIQKQHCEYLQEKPHLKLDLVYSLMAATTVTMVIMERTADASLQWCA